MAKPSDTYDDLTAISGIGPARQKWLRDAFAARTYADLAALSASEIAAQLKLDHKIVAADVIADWIAQAGQLARQAGEQGKWKVFATFVAVFEEDDAGHHRLMVHHMETDQTEQWADSEPHKMVEWISQQLGVKPQPPAEPVQPIPQTIQPEKVQPAPVPVTPHERLQQLRAKAALLSMPPRPAAAPPAQSVRATPPTPPLSSPLSVGQQQYSERLQKFLSKARGIDVAVTAQKP